MLLIGASGPETGFPDRVQPDSHEEKKAGACGAAAPKAGSSIYIYIYIYVPINL